ncbi:condensation domain-containing protein, partial [Pseudosporangium ferrugineum]|uniref:condensation domain-containing protein n=1 Tax=Pseudosporangium ferrugineum TaxID=439699 RepID=UPI00318420C2
MKGYVNVLSPVCAFAETFLCAGGKAKHLSRRGGSVEEFTLGRSFPLSRSQHEIWLAAHLSRNDHQYVIGQYTELRGPLDERRFIDAVSLVVNGLDVLRAKVLEEAGRPVQMVRPFDLSAVTTVDVRDAPADPEVAARALLGSELQEPIDVSTDRLYKFKLIKLEDEIYWWSQVYHHIAVDMFGVDLISRLVADAYNSDGRPLSLPRSSLVDALDSERKYLETSQYTEDHQYWRQTLSGWSGSAHYFGNGRDGIAPVYKRESVQIPERVRERIAKAIRTYGVTGLEVVLAACAALLHRLTGETPVFIGVPTLGRADRGRAASPLTSANLLPLRIDVHPRTSVTELLLQVSERLKELRAHSLYPGEEIARDLELRGGIRSNLPLVVNSMLPISRPLEVERCTAHTKNLSLGAVSGLAIAILGRPEAPGTTLHFDAGQVEDSPVFSACGPAGVLRFLDTFLEAGAEANSVRRLDLLTTEERQKLLVSWNDTTTPVGPQSLPQLFEAQAAKRPQATAVVFEDQQLSYAQLNEQAN